MITKKQQKNLIKLANELLMPTDRTSSIRFDMSTFADMNHLLRLSMSCGTVGCAVGHAPSANVVKYPWESWYDFSSRALISRDKNYNEWQWCFSGIWESTDNTKQGAAQRIIYMLQYGLPEDWSDQMRGNSFLDYTHITGFCEYWLKENGF